MKKITSLLLVGIIALLGGCQKADDTDTLIVLTNSGYPPYEIIDTTGNLTGFDIELMEAIAVEMGVKIEWKDVAFEGIIASIQAGEADFAIAGLSPTDERKLSVDFSDVYFNADSGLTNFLVFDPNDNTIAGLDDLDGLVVGAQIGTVQASFLDSVATEYGFTVELRADNTTIVQEILIGNIDVLVAENAASDEIIAVNTNLTKVGFESYLDDTVGNAIALPKESPYLESLNDAIAALIADGTVDTLIAKWFN